MNSYNWTFYFCAASLAALLFSFGGHSKDEESGKAKHVSAGLSALSVVAAYLVGLYFDGVRPPTMGSDTPKYVIAFDAIQSIANSWSTGVSYFGNTEILFWPVQACFKVITGASAQIWLVSLFTATFLLGQLAYQRITKELRAPASLFAFVLFTYELVFFGNIIRQVLSYPIAIVACYAYRDKRFVRALVLAFIAIGFHWSSISFMLVPFLLRLRINTRYRAIFFLVGSLACSGLAFIAVRYLAGIPGMMGLSDKASYYSLGITNFGNVYSTFNFFGCVVAAALYILCFNRFRSAPVFNACFLLFTGLVFVGIAVPTLSERFITNQLFFAPALVWCVIDTSFAAGSGPKRLCLGLAFAALGGLVLAQQSTIETLGLG